jgi:hypothetical protein
MKNPKLLTEHTILTLLNDQITCDSNPSFVGLFAGETGENGETFISLPCSCSQSMNLLNSTTFVMDAQDIEIVQSKVGNLFIYS